MLFKKKERRNTTSCGTLTYRFIVDKNDTEGIELLLVKQDARNDRWGIPKGHVNVGETFEQCAIRETLEEAGIDVGLLTRLDDVNVTYRHEFKTVVTFLARQICDRNPSSDHPESEVNEARWFNSNHLPTLCSYQRSLILNGIAAIFALHDDEQSNFT
jgi:8-oxo-dGTP pyrophosphatase MutT (NUDIX family)